MRNNRSQVENPGRSEKSRMEAPLYKNGKRPSALLYVIIVAITLAAIAVTIFLGKKNYRETIRLATKQFNQQQLILARSAARGIGTFIADVDDDLLALSNFPVVQRMEPGILERMEVLYQGIPPQTSSRRLDKNGILRFIYPNEGWRKDLIGRDYSQETWFQKAKKTGKVVISGLIINEAGERRIRVVRPVYVKDEKGTREFNGVIKCSINPETMANLFISPAVSGKTGYACLLNEDGVFLAHHEEAFVGRDAFKVRAKTNPELSYNTINNIQQQMMAGKEGVGRYVSGWHRGEKGELEKLIAYTPVHVLDKIWSVAVCAPVDEVERITSEAYRKVLYAVGIIILILTAAGVFSFILLHRWTRSLQQEIEIRKQAEERIVHLNAVLRAIRGVNQLIVREKDRDRLLQDACDILIKNRGYHSAWIALVDEDGRLVTAVQAGVDSGFPAMVEDQKRGELTRCIRQAVDQSGVVVVADPAVECGDCPLAGIYAGKARLIARLEHGGRVYGFITVTVSVEMAADEEEQWLFEEVAGDIAFALHDMELKEERKRAEERIRNLMESLPVGVSISTPEGGVPEVNKATWKIFGYNSKEEFEKIPSDTHYYDPKDRDQFVELHKKGLVKDFEVRFKRKDGSVFWGSVSSTTKTIEAGTTEFINVFEDITERKQAEEALQESEERYRSLIETSHEMIQSVRSDGYFDFVNKAWHDILGYTEKELSELSLFDIIHPESLDHCQKMFKKVLAGESATNVEAKFVTKDGSTVFVEGNVTGRYIDDKLVATQGFFRDITDRKHLEDRLRQAQKMEAIGTLAGGIAHDFNNILAAIIGYTEVATLQVGEDTKLKENLGEVLKAGRRARELVKQILAFSRQSDQERMPIQMRSIVKETIKLLRASLPTTIEIRQNIESVLATVEADPTQMQQVMMNFCTNALHAMSEEGGILEINLSEIELDSYTASQYPDLSPGKYVRLTVSDTGYGMDKEIMERIFDPYFTTKEKEKGTGLGLSVVHGIVKSHGGAITVYSEPGKGSTFHVYIPAIQREVVEEKDEIEPLPTGHESILFIDDEQVLVDVGKQMLEHLGYEVTTRTSSIEALELFLAKPDQFDLVITDMTMPHMTGDKLAQELMQIRPDIPIILCTGFSGRISEEKAKGMGIKAFAMKPIVLSDLAKTVREVLEGGKEKPAEGLILVIDDDDQFRGMLREMLGRAGYEVADAPNGKEGIRLYRENPADLVITDIIMPEKEGMETIMDLRREFPEVKIIAMSGGGRIDPEEYLHMAEKLGANRTFAKPVERDELLKAVREVLGDPVLSKRKG